MSGKAFRHLLCASVSTLALASISAQAADLPKKAPPAWAPAPSGTLTVWAEGGAFWTGKNGDPFFVPNELRTAFATTGLPVRSIDPRVGGEGAVGLDYNFGGTPWHLSFDMRYGAATAATLSNAVSTPSGSLASAESLGDRENHGEADFMIGHDFGAMSQIKLGLRVAYLDANVNNNIGFSSVSSGGGTVATALASVDERSSFVGAGPRLAVEGVQPFGSSWALEYMAGVAALVGERQLNVNDTVSCGTTTACIGTLGLAAGVFTSQFSEVAPIFNADASLALAYSWGTSKLSLGFRFDGYWDALRTANTTGATSNINRLYYGPFVRVSTRF